jgi:tyrosinase
MKWPICLPREREEIAYHPLNQLEELTVEPEERNECDDRTRDATKPHYRRRRKPLLAALLAIAFFIVIAIIAILIAKAVHHSSPDLPVDTPAVSTDNTSPSTESLSAPHCPIRREWRTLSPPEQQTYISSVHCLTSIPSLLHPSTQIRNLYGAFPYIHSHVGYRTHHSALFLPWHRYFLHLYHSALQTHCNYTGELVYWDWTLDWADLASAPVFDVETGFGGDGETDGEITVGKTGRCVRDGPFSDIVADYYDVKYQPHCLSRGFRDDNGYLGVIGNGKTISPASIEKVLQLDSYEDFVAALENKVHDTIPFGIGGDFETFTAPYDPLFYLHHTQLDRIWWMWQQRKPEERLQGYGGHNGRHSIEEAKLTDTIEMRGFAPDVEVKAVMYTEGDLLCYAY